MRWENVNFWDLLNVILPRSGASRRHPGKGLHCYKVNGEKIISRPCTAFNPIPRAAEISVWAKLECMSLSQQVQQSISYPLVLHLRANALSPSSNIMRSGLERTATSVYSSDSKTKGKQAVHRSLFRCPRVLNHSPLYLSPLDLSANWITIGFYNVIYKMSWRYDLQTSLEYHIKHNRFPYYTIIGAMQIESIHEERKMMGHFKKINLTSPHQSVK